MLRLRLAQTPHEPRTSATQDDVIAYNVADGSRETCQRARAIQDPESSQPVAIGTLEDRLGDGCLGSFPPLRFPREPSVREEETPALSPASEGRRMGHSAVKDPLQVVDLVIAEF